MILVSISRTALYGAILGALIVGIWALMLPDDPLTGITPMIAGRVAGGAMAGAIIGLAVAVVTNFRERNVRERDLHDR